MRNLVEKLVLKCRFSYKGAVVYISVQPEAIYFHDWLISEFPLSEKRKRELCFLTEKCNY